MEEMKPLTPIDVFNGILQTARESGNFKEVDTILEFSSPTYFDEDCLRPIYNEELGTEFRVNYGGSEGIYVDAYLLGSLSGKGANHRLLFGTLQTQERNLEAMALMGKACGILQYYSWEYFAQNYRKFQPNHPSEDKVDPRDMPIVCPACRQPGHLKVSTKNEPRECQKAHELLAIRCNNCGIQTEYHTTAANLLQAWEKDEYSFSNNGTILVHRESLKKICKHYGKKGCDRKCENCHLKLIKELRNIR
jgi:hypothetical protein